MKKIDNPDTQLSIGLPFGSQVFGGYRKQDVLSYIEGLAAEVACERKELAEEKSKLYALMERGQSFSDELLRNAEKDAARMIAEAQHVADEVIGDAKRECAELKEEQNRLRTQYLEQLKTLYVNLTRQRQETDESYHRMVQPLEFALRSLEEKRNDL